MKKLREVFAELMTELGGEDESLVVLVGDISHGILQPFAKQFPDRYYNIGICEPSMVNMAAGLAKVGLNPVIHTISPFITERSFEQIKLDFGYQQLSGNFITVGGAFDYSQLGCSHHCYTDVALFNHLKRANIVAPGSPQEFRILFNAIYQQDGINFFRLNEQQHDQVFADEQIQWGKGIPVLEGDAMTMVTFGYQLAHVIQAAHRLKDAHGIAAEVLHFPTLKPFDAELVRNSVAKTGHVLVVEELSAYGGVFEQVLRACVGLEGIACDQIAIADFIYGYGTHAELCAQVGLSPEGIFAKARKLMNIE